MLSARLCGSIGLGLLAAWASGASAEPREVDKNLFLTAVAAHLSSVDTDKSIFGNFFNTGDVDLFVNTVDGWLEGVVVDPDYLNVTLGEEGTDALTQPKGWSGWSRSLVQDTEQRYNGYIILQSFDPNDVGDVTTATHEAIHAFALASETGIDNDDAGAPEFLSNQFVRELQPKLKAARRSKS
jgi:hypothetical protein